MLKTNLEHKHGLIFGVSLFEIGHGYEHGLTIKQMLSMAGQEPRGFRRQRALNPKPFKGLKVPGCSGGYLAMLS